MRKLYCTTGPPFAQAVQIVLGEKRLPFECDETYTTPSVEARARITPTLQVPTSVDGDLRLWDSAVILEYLVTTYPNPAASEGHQRFAPEYARPDHRWRDKLVHATRQTFGVSTSTVSQLQWSGVQQEDNGHASRCATCNQHLLDWFETELASTQAGFVPGLVSVRDVLLGAWCEFIERRPLRLTWRAPHRRKIEALAERLHQRPSFQRERALWWEPGVTYVDPEEITWAARKTIHEGSTFLEWLKGRTAQQT